MTLHERLAELERLFGKKHPHMRCTSNLCWWENPDGPATYVPPICIPALLDAIAAEWWMGQVLPLPKDGGTVAVRISHYVIDGKSGVYVEVYEWFSSDLNTEQAHMGRSAPTIHEAVIAGMKARKNETV